MQVPDSGGTVASCNVIDWAADKTVPGAGAMLYRHIQAISGTMINIGGTADARRVLPGIGFEVRVSRQVFRLVVRPWRKFRAEHWDWKSPLRLARDLRGGGPGDPLQTWRSAPPVFPERTAELFDYVRACPAAEVTLHRLPLGYVLLSLVGAQCRIADLLIRSEDAQDWATAYTAAASTARADGRIAEVVAAVSSPLQAEALRQAGFRRTHEEPVFVMDPQRRLENWNDLAISFLENDGYYWQRS